MRVWTRDEVIAESPEIPVSVDDNPMVTKGRILVDGNNPWVIAKLDKCNASGSQIEVAGRFSWGAVLQALNEPGYPLPIPINVKRM